MQKPDTAAARYSNYQPVSLGTDDVLQALLDKATIIDELCEYIDSLDTELRALDWYRSALLPRLKPALKEGQAVHGMWEKPTLTAGDKVTTAQVRAFVDNSMHESSCREPKRLADILDFIDSGLNKKKPTAEEIIEECIEGDYQLSGNNIAKRLREAGYLNDGEK